MGSGGSQLLSARQFSVPVTGLAGWVWTAERGLLVGEQLANGWDQERPEDWGKAGRRAFKLSICAEAIDGLLG